MLSSLVPSSNALGATTRHIVVGAVLVAVGYLAARVASPATDSAFGPGIGRVAAAKHAASDPARAGLAASPAVTNESARDFDYFPDHYVNQAREVAEQPPTF